MKLVKDIFKSILLSAIMVFVIVCVVTFKDNYTPTIMTVLAPYLTGNALSFLFLFLVFTFIFYFIIFMWED